LKTGGRVSLVGFGSWSVSQEARDGRNPQTGKTIQIAAKNVVKSKCRIRRCSKLIVSFKPIIIKPSLWKVFYVFKRFYLVFYYLFLNLLKNYRVMISEKLIKGQLLSRAFYKWRYHLIDL
jgi:hypothetical protein